MTYLLDTDVVADWLQGKPAAVQLISSLPQDALAISLVTYGEIYDGIYGGRNPTQSERGFREFLTLVTGNTKHFARIPDLDIH